VVAGGSAAVVAGSGRRVRAAKAHQWQASARRLLRTRRAWTQRPLPDPPYRSPTSVCRHRSRRPLRPHPRRHPPPQRRPRPPPPARATWHSQATCLSPALTCPGATSRPAPCRRRLHRRDPLTRAIITSTTFAGAKSDPRRVEQDRQTILAQELVRERPGHDAAWPCFRSKLDAGPPAPPRAVLSAQSLPHHQRPVRRGRHLSHRTVRRRLGHASRLDGTRLLGATRVG
jgi:hypothetical protein